MSQCNSWGTLLQRSYLELHICKFLFRAWINNIRRISLTRGMKSGNSWLVAHESRTHTLNFMEWLLFHKPTTAHALLTLRVWRNAGKRILGCLSLLKVYTVQVWIRRTSLHNHQKKSCNIWQIQHMSWCIFKWKNDFLIQMNHQDSWNSRTQK